MAASGTPVLKHGNRAASSKSGGADMLEALGFDIADGHVNSPAHPDFRLRFLFAAAYHPAMRYAGPVRSQLAVPTLFNLLGPLTNPAQPKASLIGCAFEDQMETMAGAFARRGQRVLVVRGSDGLDEITVTGPTRVFIVEDGNVTEDIIDPLDHGMTHAPAIVSIWSSKAQPMRLAAGCAGLVSGPRRLNRVGTANCERPGPA